MCPNCENKRVIFDGIWWLVGDCDQDRIKFCPFCGTSLADYDHKIERKNLKREIKEMMLFPNTARSLLIKKIRDNADKDPEEFNDIIESIVEFIIL